MRLPVNVVLQGSQPGELCSQCHKDVPCIRVSLFIKDGLADSDPVCPKCIGAGGGVLSKLELEEPDVEVGRKKTLRRQKKVSREQEVDIAEELGARVQKNSGAVSGSKGDVRKKGVARIEAKFTTAKTYALSHVELLKIAGECADGERPVMIVDFQESLTNRLKDRYAVIPFGDLKELLDAHNR